MREEDGSKSSLTSDSRHIDKRLFVHTGCMRHFARKKLFFTLHFVSFASLASKLAKIAVYSKKQKALSPEACNLGHPYSYHSACT